MGRRISLLFFKTYFLLCSIRDVTARAKEIAAAVPVALHDDDAGACLPTFSNQNSQC